MRKAQQIEIQAPRGNIYGVVHVVENAHSAMLMVGGAGGGIQGPAGIYAPLAERLRGAGVESLRLEYRTPNDLDECIYDVRAGIEALSQRGAEKVTLLGWSFGGAVVISAGASSDKVAGVATVASQTFGADASRLHHKSLLLIHGTADDVLPDRCSKQLYREAHEPKELVLYAGDNHGVTGHASEMLEKLYEWSLALLTEQTANGHSKTRPHTDTTDVSSSSAGQ